VSSVPLNLGEIIVGFHLGQPVRFSILNSPNERVIGHYRGIPVRVLFETRERNFPPQVDGDVPWEEIVAERIVFDSVDGQISAETVPYAEKPMIFRDHVYFWGRHGGTYSMDLRNGHVERFWSQQGFMHDGYLSCNADLQNQFIGVMLYDLRNGMLSARIGYSYSGLWVKVDIFDSTFFQQIFTGKMIQLEEAQQIINITDDGRFASYLDNEGYKVLDVEKRQILEQIPMVEWTAERSQDSRAPQYLVDRHLIKNTDSDRLILFGNLFLPESSYSYFDSGMYFVNDLETQICKIYRQSSSLREDLMQRVPRNDPRLPPQIEDELGWTR
jgi:hypothetical protein